MKKILKKTYLFLLLILTIHIVLATETTVLYENFEDGEISNNSSWRTLGTNYYLINSEFHSDGSVLDQSGRKIVLLFSELNITDASNLMFSYKGILKSNGTPLQGIGIEMIVANTQESYRLNIQDGATNGFPNNKHSISLAYGADNTLKDYIYTNYVPQKDIWYNVKAIRKNGEWNLYVDNFLIGSINDTRFLKNFSSLTFGLHGSVGLDTINITISTPDDPPSVDPDLITFAPVFYLHQNEAYEPKEIGSMTENADLKEKPDTILKEAPTSISDVTDLDNSNNMFFDLKNVDMNTYFPMPPAEDFESYGTKIYGSAVTDENNYKHLQYFIFYPFQKWYTMSHEGDWELVQVTINPGNQIESVQYFFEYFTMIYYDTDLINILEGTHPAVIVGSGSHNNYADIEPIKFEGEYDYVSNFLGRFKNLDKVSSNGKVFKPEGMDIDDANEEMYTIEQIYTSSPLVDFKGRWGQIVENSLANSPKGPRYSPKFSYKWRDPTEMSYAPVIPYIAVFLYSPLNIKLESEGTSIDWGSEEVLFYNGKEAEPEAAMATGHKNFTVNLEAESEGNFTLVVFYYDNETDKGIMVKYTGIKNFATTKAKVDASQTSYFILYVDENGDGEYEKRYLPDEIIKYNDFTYQTPDEDNDGINDLVDNCPENPNSGQEDIDNDTIGDVCDQCNDPDQDLICDPNDNCQYIYNPTQEDIDKDNIGDLCDNCIDIDSDNICDQNDNCPEAYNPLQEDIDKDNLGDACDSCIDIDKDGICSSLDNCQEAYNPNQEDIDKDGLGDACDLCQDTDKDTVCEPEDNCPEIYNPTQADFNTNNKGDMCDNPIFYKKKALEIIENTNPENKLTKLKLWLAEKSLEISLSKDNWKDEFTIRSQRVFVEELICEQHADNLEVSELLAKADKLIVEKVLLQEDKNTKKYQAAKKVFDEGNNQYLKKDYRKAILRYMESWILLKK